MTCLPSTEHLLLHVELHENHASVDAKSAQNWLCRCTNPFRTVHLVSNYTVKSSHAVVVRWVTEWWRSIVVFTQSLKRWTALHACRVICLFSASLTTLTAAKVAVGSRTPASLRQLSPRASWIWCRRCQHGHPSTADLFTFIYVLHQLCMQYI